MPELHLHHRASRRKCSKSRRAGTWSRAWVHMAVCMSLPTVSVICGSLRQSGRSAAAPPFSGWLPYITERLMRPDRAGVMFGGSRRQVPRASCWAQPIMSRGCYTVITKSKDPTQDCDTFKLSCCKEWCLLRCDLTEVINITSRCQINVFQVHFTGKKLKNSKAKHHQDCDL